MGFVLWLLYLLEMNNVAVVSEVRAASNFGVELKATLP
jgi:hypothetical protein